MSNNRSFTIGFVVLLLVVSIILGGIIWLGQRVPATNQTSSSTSSSLSTSLSSDTSSSSNSSDAFSSADSVSSTDQVDLSIYNNESTSSSPYDPSLIP